jgi:hypothetical protein
MEAAMSVARYVVVGKDGSWSIEHDGQCEGEYATKEAAFEAAVGAASNAIKDGHSVTINVPGSDSRSAIGQQASV